MMYTWIIVFGVLVLGIILYSGKRVSKMIKRESPLEILDRRYVNGEISKEEYVERKQSINAKK